MKDSGGGTDTLLKQNGDGSGSGVNSNDNNPHPTSPGVTSASSSLGESFRESGKKIIVIPIPRMTSSIRRLQAICVTFPVLGELFTMSCCIFSE